MIRAALLGLQAFRRTNAVCLIRAFLKPAEFIISSPHTQRRGSAKTLAKPGAWLRTGALARRLLRSSMS